MSLVTFLLTSLVHLVLLASAIGLLFLVINIIFRFLTPRSSAEVVMRCLAAACGLLFYIGAKAIGVSIPEMAFSALSTTFPFAIGLLGVILPSSLIGFLVAWYIIKQLRHIDRMQGALGVRVLVIVITFVFFLYCDSYLASFGSNTKDAFVHLLPNLVFVLSVLMYAILRYDPEEIAALQKKFDPTVHEAIVDSSAAAQKKTA